jgi:hypothetical protein
VGSEGRVHVSTKPSIIKIAIKKKECNAEGTDLCRAQSWPGQITELRSEILHLKWILTCALLPPVIVLISAFCLRSCGECEGRTPFEFRDAISRIEQS